jgi:hypothetical protein
MTGIQIQNLHYISKDSSLEKEIQNLLGTSNPINCIKEELFSTTINSYWVRNQDPLIVYLMENSDYSSENEPYNYELESENIEEIISIFKERLELPADVLSEDYNLTLGTGATNEYRISLREYLEVFEKIPKDNGNIILVSVNW